MMIVWWKFPLSARTACPTVLGRFDTHLSQVFDISTEEIDLGNHWPHSKIPARFHNEEHAIKEVQASGGRNPETTGSGVCLSCHASATFKLG